MLRFQNGHQPRRYCYGKQCCCGLPNSPCSQAAGRQAGRQAKICRWRRHPDFPLGHLLDLIIAVVVVISAAAAVVVVVLLYMKKFSQSFLTPPSQPFAGVLSTGHNDTLFRGQQRSRLSREQCTCVPFDRRIDLEGGHTSSLSSLE